MPEYILGERKTHSMGAMIFLNNSVLCYQVHWSHQQRSDNQIETLPYIHNIYLLSRCSTSHRRLGFTGKRFCDNILI